MIASVENGQPQVNGNGQVHNKHRTRPPKVRKGRGEAAGAPKVRLRRLDSVPLLLQTTDRPGSKRILYGENEVNRRMIKDESLEHLAAELCVSPESLKRLGVGHDGTDYTFPEFDGEGYIIGIHKRKRDGSKSMVAGSARGLAVPSGLRLNETDTLYIVEGHTDTAAGITMELKCIGRPGCKLSYLPELLRDVPEKCKIVMVGENDGADGEGGWFSAQELAQELADELGRAIHVARVPDGNKDTREYLIERWIDEEDYHKQIGEWYKEALLEYEQVVEPTGADRFDVLNMAGFMSVKEEHDWLVEKILARDQPCVFGGGKKMLKTSVAIDLAISLATGTNFLGHFEVRTKRRVGVFSAESGKITLKGLAKRILRRLGDGCPQHEHIPIYWCFDVPKFSDETDLKALTYRIRQHKLEVVIIDPLYLCALSGSKSGDASNMYHMGPLFRAAADACLKAGATPIYVHHSRKMPNSGKDKWSKYEPLDLDDLAFAGIAEFARQWVLLSRREAYLPHEGTHQLWLSVGGSAFGGRVYGLTVEEGKFDGTFSGRKWIPRITSFEDVIEEQQLLRRDRQAAKEAAKNDQRQQILDILALPEFKDGATLTKLRNKGINRARLAAGLEALCASGEVEQCNVIQPGGPGNRAYAAYRLKTQQLKLKRVNG